MIFLIYKFSCRFQRFFGSKEAVRAETDAIEKHLAEFNIPVVLSHNDLWVGNIIYNDKTGACIPIANACNVLKLGILT